MEDALPGKREIKGALLLGGVYMLMYLMVYGVISVRHGMVWDEMLDAEGAATGQYVAAGRWGLALYRLVFGEGIFPWVAGMMAGVYISASLVWQVRMLALEALASRLFYGAIYVACIQWAYQLEYSHQSDAVAFGLLLSTAAVWCLRRGRWAWCVGAMVLAYAIYQTIALHTLCLLLALGLQECARFRARSCAKGAALVVSALLLSMVLARVSFLLPWVDAEEIASQRSYQSGLSRWSEFPVDGTLGAQLGFLWYYGSRFFKMTCKNMLGCAYAGQWVYATVLIPLSMLLVARFRRGFPLVSLAYGVGYVLMWALPFCPILLLFSDQGPRVNMAEPLALAALWALALPLLRERFPRAWAPVLAALAVFALVKSAYRVGDIAMNEACVFEREVACVRAMHTRAMCAAESAGVRKTRIILLGDIPAHPEVTWPRRKCLEGRGISSPPELLSFYTRYLGVDNMRKATPQDMERHAEAYRSMPSWPAAGSVRVDGGEVVIRVGDCSGN